MRIISPEERAVFDVFKAFLHQLQLANDWDADDGPMRFSSNLALADLANAEIFLNARVFFAALAAENGTAATATGNLTRAFRAVNLVACHAEGVVKLQPAQNARQASKLATLEAWLATRVR